MHKNIIPNVVLPDRNARPAGIALITAWHHLYPNERVPNVYFINPDALSNDKFTKRLEEFKRVHKYLARSYREPVMIFDTCLHSGQTVGSVYGILKLAGFREIYTGFAQPPVSFLRRENLPPISFMALPIGCYEFCQPFGKDRLVRKGNSLVSRRNRRIMFFDGNIKNSYELRRDVSNTFEEKEVKRLLHGRNGLIPLIGNLRLISLLRDYSVA